MSVTRTPQGRYRAKLKSGRVDVASRTFDTRREATAWLARERAALDGGVDPRSGRQRVKDVLENWLEVRRTTVATKTLQRDRDLRRLMPPSLQAMRLSAVSEREVARSFETLLGRGLAESSVVRYRASLSAFCGWCVREKLIASNPVTAVRVPKQSVEATEMFPFSEAELEAAYLRWSLENQRLADVLLVMAWTGLRWSEARAVIVADLVEVPTPGILVRRAEPEGVRTKSTKGRRSRRVPLANRVMPLVIEMAEGKSAGDLLFTTDRGSQLHRTALGRAVRWSVTGAGRRVHDLRHTAACLWLARGVEPGTVQAWMGHESIATTNIYLHFLGSSAHQVGLERLNSESGGAGGASGRSGSSGNGGTPSRAD